MFRYKSTGMMAGVAAIVLPRAALAQAASIELVESRLLGATPAISPASPGTAASTSKQSDKLALRTVTTPTERGRSVLRDAIKHNSATETRRTQGERGSARAVCAGITRVSGYQSDVAEQRQQRRGDGAGSPGAGSPGAGSPGAGRGGKGGSTR